MRTSPLLRGSALLLVATLAGNAAAYVFNVIAGRVLGPIEYGSTLALISALSILAVPARAMQVMTASAVSRAAVDGPTEERAEIQSQHQTGLLLAGGMFAAFTIIAYPLARSLAIDSFGSVLAVGVAASCGVLLGTSHGALQGSRRFGTLALALVAEPALRLAALVALLLIGARLSAPVVAFLVGYAGVYLALRGRLRGRSVHHASPRTRDRRLKAIIPYTCAVAFATALYNLDVLVARATLPAAEAGIYSAGSVLGRAVFFTGSAAGMALLPTIAAAQTPALRLRYLAEALLFAGAVALVPTLAYVVAPLPVIAATFGTSFRDLQPHLWLFGTAMLLYTFANLALSYLIALSRWTVITPLLMVIVAQGGMLAAWHHDVRAIASVQLAVMALANAGTWPLVVHELRKASRA